MTNGDEKLRVLLKEWRDVEPGPAFEAQVWRRIRAPDRREAGIGWVEALRELWANQPAWATAAALVAAVVLGIRLGLAPLSPPSVSQFALARPGSVTGNYVSMISGGTR